MATPPVKPTTSTPSKPNPLHGAPPTPPSHPAAEPVHPREPRETPDPVAAVAAVATANDEAAQQYAEQYEKEQAQRVVIPGSGPQSDMQREVEIDPSTLSENTRAEMEAGKAALKAYGDRTKNEHEAGRKSIPHNKPVTPEE